MSNRNGIALALCLTVLPFAAGCGPNVFTAKGKVLHPLHRFETKKDAEAPRPTSRLAISRRETRVAQKHVIVGYYALPPALKTQRETAEIIGYSPDAWRLTVDIEIYSNVRSEMDLADYEYVLLLDDGRRIKGSVHRQGGLVDLTVKITGAHSQVHMVVKDGNRATAYSHIEEVENDFEFFRRKVRVVFEAPRLITRETTGATVVMTGFQRQRRYAFGFTWDPYEAMEWAISGH